MLLLVTPALRKFFLITLIVITSSVHAFAQKSNAAKYKQLSAGKTISGFIKNYGQVKALEGGDASMVLYSFTSVGADVYITTKGISYVYSHPLSKVSLQASKETYSKNESVRPKEAYEVERVDASLENALIDTNHVLIEYHDEPTLHHYYDGDLQVVSQRMIRRIIFKNVYPGIDWAVYDGSNKGKAKIKYDFIVNRKGSEGNISIRYSSNAQISTNNDRSLTVKSRLGTITEGTPVVFNNNAKATRYKCGYRVTNNNISFDLSRAALSYPFTIDPDLYWGTFLHTLSPYTGLEGSNIQTTDIEADNKGNIYISLNAEGKIKFPTVNPGGGAYYSNVYDSLNGSNVFMKFSESGVLLWSTYFVSGVNMGAEEPCITVDNAGNLIVASKYTKVLPLKDNGGYFDTSLYENHRREKYLSKFSPGGLLVWSTPFAFEELMFNDITHDDNDNFYVTGTTTHNTLPLKDPGNGAYVNYKDEYGYHPFVSKFDKDNRLLWSTDIPGSNDRDFTRIAADNNSNVYVLATYSRSKGYPVVDAGGFSSTEGIAAITKFNSAYKMVWSSKLPTFAHDVEVDDGGNVYVVGATMGGNSFPYTDPGNGAYMDPRSSVSQIGGCILKFDVNTKLTWATTFFGGYGFWYHRIVFDRSRDIVHLNAIMNDGTLGFPSKNDDCNGSYYKPAGAPNSATDRFISTFTTAGKWLYTSFNGFPRTNYGEMAVDQKGNLLFAYAQIQEVLTNMPFPALKDPGNGAYYQELSDNYLAEASFIMKLITLPVKVNSIVELPKGCDCTGTIKIEPVCSAGNYKYTWSRGDSTNKITNVCPGTYTVRVVDENSNNDTTLTINIPNPPSNINRATLLRSDEHCDKGDGTLIIKAANSNALPYTYSVNKGDYSPTSTFSGLNAGKYIINIKDNDGCLLTDSTTIDSVAGPVTIYTSVIPTACEPANGQITVDSIKGGTGPFTYAIDNGPAGSPTTFGALQNKKYAIRVIDSAGCDLLDSIEVKKVKGPDGFETVLNNSECGQTLGSIMVTGVSGGRNPYLYSLDNQQFSGDSLFKNLPAGTRVIHIKDANGCIYNKQVDLSFRAYPTLKLHADTILCDQSTLFLDASQSIANVTYLWQDGSTKAFLTANQAGTYIVKVATDGCAKADTCTIGYKYTPAFYLGNDTTLCVGQNLPLSVNVAGGASYRWNNGSGASTYTVSSPGTYKVTATNDCGSFSDEIIINTGVCNIEMPTAFTPNKDGLNDVFRIKYPGLVRSVLMQVFNRLGQVVFSTKDPTKGWDGTINGREQDTGNFIWTIRYETVDGSKGNLKGSVLLIK